MTLKAITVKVSVDGVDMDTVDYLVDSDDITGIRVSTLDSCLEEHETTVLAIDQV